MTGWLNASSYNPATAPNSFQRFPAAPERGKKTMLDMPVETLRAELAKASKAAIRHRSDRQDIPPHYDDIDHLWHYKIGGAWGECPTSEQAWEEFDGCTKPIAAE